MLLQGASQRGALPSRGGLGAGVIAASHMITKTAHARTSVATAVAAQVIGSDIVAFGFLFCLSSQERHNNSYDKHDRRPYHANQWVEKLTEDSDVLVMEIWRRRQLTTYLAKAWPLPRPGHREKHCRFRSSSPACRINSSVQCDHP